MARRPAPDELELVRLLWLPAGEQRVRPGPKSSLSLAGIVQAGIDIADDRTGPALSMRSVGGRVGVTPMALYSYVDGKQTLLQLMYDAVHAELTLPPEARVADWVEAVAELYARHHWLVEVSWSRPVLGPHEQAALEQLLGVLQHTSVPAAMHRAVVSTLFTLARAAGRAVAEARDAERATGLTDEQWWAARSAAMAEVVPDFTDRYPLSAGLDPGSPSSHQGRVRGGYVEQSTWSGLWSAVDLLLAGAGA